MEINISFKKKDLAVIYFFQQNVVLKPYFIVSGFSKPLSIKQNFTVCLMVVTLVQK